MKNHELLDMIGEAGEEYVLAADSKVVRPPFRWPALAACAACAALVLCAYPIYKAAAPQASEGNTSPLLHSYAIVGDSSGTMKAETADASNEDIAPAEGFESARTTGEAAPEEPATGFGYIAENGEPASPAGSIAGAAAPPHTDEYQDDAPAADKAAEDPVPEPAYAPPISQDAAIIQYNRLYAACDLEGNPPEWYAGAWLDNDYENQECRLAVSIVAGYHTPELEAQIQDWCGGPVLFVQDMKYPYARLLDMLEQINQALEDHLNQDDAWSTFSYMRADIMNNCLEVGFSDLPSDAALAFLAQLDPEGDAIHVQAHTGAYATLDAMEDPAVQPTPAPEVEDLPQSKYGGAG